MEWTRIETELPEIGKEVLLETDGGVIQGRLLESIPNLKWGFIGLDCHGCGCCASHTDKVFRWMKIPK